MTPLQDGTFIYAHDGATGGYRAKISFSREYKKGFLWLTNSPFEIQCFKGVVFLEKECIPSFGYQVSLESLSLYPGLYQDEESKIIFKITKFKDRLTYEIPNQETGALIALSETEFTASGIAFFHFIVNGNGVIDEFTFKQGNWAGTFKRVKSSLKIF